MIGCQIDFSIIIHARANFSCPRVLEDVLSTVGKHLFLMKSFCFCAFQFCLRLRKMWHGAGPMMKAVLFNPGSRLREKSTYAALNH